MWRPLLCTATLVGSSHATMHIGAAVSTLHLGHAVSALQLNHAVSAYSTALATRPLMTKLATAAVLGLSGDWVAQKREPEPFDHRRSASFIAFNTLYRGIIQNYAFQWMSVICAGQLLGSTRILVAMERTLFNQFVIVPTAYYPLFFAISGALQGLTPSQSLRRARTHFLPLMSSTLAFWIPVNLVQFCWVPSLWQVPFVCLVGFIWTMILSMRVGKCEDLGRHELDQPVPSLSPRPVAERHQGHATNLGAIQSCVTTAHPPWL